MIYEPNCCGKPEPWQLDMIGRLKHGGDDREVPVIDFDGQRIGHVRTMRFADLESELPTIFVKWRNQNRCGWRDQRPVTLEGTKRWMRNVLSDPRRMNVLFYFRDKLIGRGGILDLGSQGYMSDGIVRGERGGGIDFMNFVNMACMSWDFEHLKIEKIYSMVVSSNTLALGSTSVLGYELIGSVALYRRESTDGVELVEESSAGALAEERLYYLVCHHNSFKLARERAWRSRSFENHETK